MRKISIIVMIALFAITNLMAENPTGKKDFIGEWKFTSQYAPDGYQNGTFVITEEEGTLKGEVRFSDNFSVPMNNMNINDGVLKFSITAEYNEVPISATVEGNKLKGTASSPEGDLPFEAVKVVKQQ